MKVCILSGRYPVTQFNSPINHKLYADKFGYKYIHCNYPTKAKNPYLNKIHYILSYIDDYDYIIWIDDDAFFLDFEKDFMKYVPKGNSFMSVCKSPNFKELKTFISSGQFILKSNKVSKKFLETILNTELNLVKKWWRDDLGYFSDGDQDIMIYLFHTNREFKDKLDLYDYKKFNSRCENFFEKDVHKPFIIHFTGRGPTKLKNLYVVQRKLNLHASLVSDPILNSYGIAIQDFYGNDRSINKKRTILILIKRKLQQWLKG